MANYMKDLAAVLGLELGEEFQLKDVTENYVYALRYRITEEGLEHFDTVYGEWKPAIGTTYKFLLNGQNSIIKKPWKPDEGDFYYVPSTPYGQPDNHRHMWGIDSDTDKRCYNAGLVCKTSEEASKLAKIMLEAVQNYGESNEE